MHSHTARTLIRLAGVLLVLVAGAAIAIFGSPVPSLAAASVVAVALGAVQGRLPSPPDPHLLRLAARLLQGAPGAQESRQDDVSSG